MPGMPRRQIGRRRMGQPGVGGQPGVVPNQPTGWGSMGPSTGMALAPGGATFGAPGGSPEELGTRMGIAPGGSTFGTPGARSMGGMEEMGMPPPSSIATGFSRTPKGPGSIAGEMRRMSLGGRDMGGYGGGMMIGGNMPPSNPFLRLGSSGGNMEPQPLDRMNRRGFMPPPRNMGSGIYF